MRFVAAAAAILLLAQLSGRGTAFPVDDQLAYDRMVATHDALKAQLASTGSTLSQMFDAGRASQTATIDAPSTPSGRPAALTVWAPGQTKPPSGPPTGWPPALAADLRTQLDALDLNRVAAVEIRFGAASGAPGFGSTKIAWTQSEAMRWKTELRTTNKIPRDGGLVLLEGGKLRFRTHANVLADTELDVCGKSYCLRFTDPAHKPAGTGETVPLPFSPSPLFTTTWKLAYNGGEAFYLTINPTKVMLKGSSGLRIPTGKLELDPAEPRRANEIVTGGGIDGTELRQILLDADIAFKSADLGYDVKAGIKKPTPATPDDLPDPLAPPKHASSRWCRYAWQSGDQALDLTPRGVAFVGSSIRAEAEPMRLVDGELQPYPAGRWCGRAEAVAKQLNAQVAAGTAPASVAKLAAVASIQTFARFVRDNRMKTTPAFAASLESNPPMAADKLPPPARWTSGIRSNVQPVVRLDYRVDPETGLPRRYLIFYGPITPALIDQFIKELDRIEVLAMIPRSRGGHDFNIVERELQALQRKLANMHGARILSPLGPTAPASGRWLALGIEPIDLPVTIHGGVLLAASARAREAAIRNSTLLYPDGKPLFRATATGDLHFWSFQQPGWSAGKHAGEHLELRGATVIGRHADRGTLRFVVQGKEVSSRREVRFPPKLPGYPNGVEWTHSLAHHGVQVDLGFASWTDADGNPQAKPMRYQQLINTPHLPTQDLLVQITSIDVTNGLWLVEVHAPFAPVLQQVEQRHRDASKSQDPAAMSAAIADAVQWGAHEEAGRWLEALDARLPSTSSDTLLAAQATEHSVFAEILVALAREELAKLPDKVIRSRDQLLVPLAALAKIVRALPPPRAREIEKAVVDKLKQLDPAASDLKKLIGEQRAEHIRRYRIAHALTGGQP